jgi:hypothetical protein
MSLSKAEALAKQTLANRYAYLRKLRADGKHERVLSYAKTYHLDVSLIGDAPVDTSLLAPGSAPGAVAATEEIPAVPVSEQPQPAVAPEIEPEPPQPKPMSQDEAPVEMVNGWPRKSRAVYWKPCPNERLMIVKLSDGRLASMRKHFGVRWLLGQKVTVKLIKDTGDPIYDLIGLGW